MSLFGLFGCSNKMDLENIYPYIITKEYLVDGIKEETVVIDTIGKDLYLTLVKDLNGLVENVRISELKRNNISTTLATQTAKNNLDKLFKEQKIKPMLFEGPNGLPFILFSDHWLSSASLFWTKIYSFSSKNLKTDTIYVSIPQRDAMILFPKCSAKELSDFKKMIKEKESNARKPLTFEVFQLDKNGLKTIK